MTTTTVPAPASPTRVPVTLFVGCCGHDGLPTPALRQGWHSFIERDILPYFDLFPNLRVLIDNPFGKWTSSIHPTVRPQWTAWNTLWRTGMYSVVTNPEMFAQAFMELLPNTAVDFYTGIPNPDDRMESIYSASVPYQVLAQWGRSFTLYADALSGRPNIIWAWLRDRVNAGTSGRITLGTEASPPRGSILDRADMPWMASGAWIRQGGEEPIRLGLQHHGHMLWRGGPTPGGDPRWHDGEWDWACQWVASDPRRSLITWFARHDADAIARVRGVISSSAVPGGVGAAA